MIVCEMVCANCGSDFFPTVSQWKRRHVRTNVTCSKACRYALSSTKNTVEKLTKICEKCGKEFKTKRDKYNSTRLFCGIDCYTSSNRFKKMTSENRARIAVKRVNWPHKVGFRKPYGREDRACLECGKKFDCIKSSRKKYCCHLCYREHRAKVFDRWIANPGTFKVVQGYDEFFANDPSKLKCIIDGCDWEGCHLSVHLNIAHGILAEDAKKAAGFNLGTGLVSAELSEKMRQSPQVLEAIERAEPVPGGGRRRSSYSSIEGREHHKKARALSSSEPYDKEKVCLYCGEKMQLLRGGANRAYCSTKCRSLYYRLTNGGKVTCSVCKREFMGKSDQKKRANKNLDVCCSFSCRQSRAARIYRGTWP